MGYNVKLLNRFMTGKATVHVKTQNEYDQFMELLENETDIRWMTRKKPTSYNYWENYNNDTVLSSGKGQNLSFGTVIYYKTLGYSIIEFSDLIKEGE